MRVKNLLISRAHKKKKSALSSLSSVITFSLSLYVFIEQRFTSILEKSLYLCSSMFQQLFDECCCRN